jgi:hypothetical protein
MHLYGERQGLLGLGCLNNEYVFNVTQHTDATATIWVVPFDINTCKFITSHVVLDPMEFLEKIKEVVEAFNSNNCTMSKSSSMTQNWMGRHFWHQRPGVDSAS